MVGEGSGVVLVGGVIGTVIDVLVDAGPNIAVPVDVGPGVVPVSREVVAVCGVPSSKLAGKLPSQAMFSRTMLDWALSWSTAGLETELDLVPCAALSVREPLPQLIVVTSNAADGSQCVTALLLPLMVVEVLGSLLLLLLL